MMMPLKTNGIFTIALIVHLVYSCSGFSQQLSSYSLEYLPQRSYMNPSFIPIGKFNIGIPLVSGFSYNYTNNGFRYNDLIKKKANDSLYMDATNAINGMNSKNSLRLEFEAELLSIGIKKGKSYFSINATEKVNTAFNYSKALIEFLYYGNAATLGKTQILNPGIEGVHYREYGVNWAREVNRKLKTGIKLKYLYGMENIYTKGSGVAIYTDPNDFSITANSDLTVFTSGIDSTSFGSTGFGTYAFGKSNTGFALDLGITYKPVQQIEIAISAIDWGSIKWNSNVSTYSTSTKEGAFTYYGINLNEFVNNDSTSAEAYLSNLVDSLYSSFDVTTTHESYKYKLPFQLFVSTSYLITPRYRINIVVHNKKFKSGNQTDYQFSFTGKSKTWFNYTIGLNRINKTPTTLGAGFTLNFKNDQVYFVSDNVPGLLNWKKSYNTGFRAGINIMFGTRPKYMKPPQPLLEVPVSII
ncbi:MAG: hypothetical protein IPP71_23550 [Bacteroidetes bacterium]|nr:hypothetical protein [Bacteroidota bacterium]